MEPNITTIMQQKEQLQKSLCKHVTKQRKKLRCANVFIVICVVFCFIFLNAQNSPAHGRW